MRASPTPTYTERVEALRALAHMASLGTARRADVLALGHVIAPGHGDDRLYALIRALGRTLLHATSAEQSRATLALLMPDAERTPAAVTA